MARFDSVCPIKAITGRECIGCGMTRAFMALLHFDLYGAYKYNMLSIPIFFGIVIYCFFAAVDIIYDKYYIYCIEKQLSKPYMFIVYAVLLIMQIASKFAH